ncbi:MAG: tripartite tricarboxylate transporter permease [Oceanicoccus sp.]|uniref:tripartite tricarboxylate transporter permease n=1 Tax=Oceanicoccus sp. TaxID=2691044 RepID=UPI002611B078|nr:tripartite tricarboxylate transporter permease [Oceanicoccus sp.]MCP3907630.1 tripartite tricarboxylate transporter permease [Oceanicoccus sp.]MDG1773584.1 tripartite tricarboxylate transporter permease [Oceanicoccus sp.]
MIDVDALHSGLGLLFSSFTPWLIVIPGILIGLIFGAIPGLQISMAMAIFLPMTLYMDFMQAMLFLTAIFTGGSFGGSIPAILMNIPGTSSSIATAFDGYPMSRKGEHNIALGIALGSSCIAVIIGYSMLFFLIQPISSAVLTLGPAEMSAVVLWGVTLIASLSGAHLAKGIMSGLIGLLIGTVGYSEAGVARGTLGSAYLLDGIPAIPAMMGMFAASELFKLVNTQYLVADSSARKVSVRVIFASFKRAVTYPWVILRGSVIGIFVGAIPGVGSSVANLLSYIETKRKDKNPESFGKGNPAGVVASEAANSTSEAGSMATLLALGIPGGGATAVMLAAFAMHNITGGPQFIREQTDVVYAIIFANFGQAFLLIALGLVFIPLLANIVKVPMTYLIPSVLALAVFGAFGLTGNMAGPYTVMIFSLIGWLFKRFDYSVPAAVIGILLGNMAESNLIYTYQISGAQWSYLLERPVTIGIIVLLFVSLLGGRLVNALSQTVKK